MNPSARLRIAFGPTPPPSTAAASIHKDCCWLYKHYFSAPEAVCLSWKEEEEQETEAAVAAWDLGKPGTEDKAKACMKVGQQVGVPIPQ